MGNKTIHLIAAAGMLLLASISIYKWRELLGDPPITFATISGFFTFYGVIFAVIEVIRTRSAADAAAREAKRATDRLEDAYAAQSITKCQLLIEGILARIDEEGTFSWSSLAKIAKLYAREYATQIEGGVGNHQNHISIITTYAMSVEKRRIEETKKFEVSKLKSALIGMNASLGASERERLKAEQ